MRFSNLPKLISRGVYTLNSKTTKLHMVDIRENNTNKSIGRKVTLSAEHKRHSARAEVGADNAYSDSGRIAHLAVHNPTTKVKTASNKAEQRGGRQGFGAPSTATETNSRRRIQYSYQSQRLDHFWTDGSIDTSDTRIYVHPRHATLCTEAPFSCSTGSYAEQTSETSTDHRQDAV